MNPTCTIWIPKILRWLAKWPPQFVVVMLTLFVVWAWVDLAMNVDEYDYWIGSDVDCSMARNYCSWPAYLWGLGLGLFQCAVGLLVLCLARGKERDALLWQWLAIGLSAGIVGATGDYLY